MNNRILFELGGFPIYGSAAVITLGILLCVIMTLVLYRRNHRSVAAVLFLAVAGFVFGVLFSRLLHGYFNAETYTSLVGALTEISSSLSVAYTTIPLVTPRLTRTCARGSTR